MRFRRPSLLAVAVAATLLVPAAAEAGTAAYDGDGTLVYTATDAADQLFVTLGGEGDAVRIEDQTPPDSAPDGCELAFGVLRCAVRSDRGVRIDLRGGDDSLTFGEAANRVLPVRVLGGDGADRLSGAQSPGSGETLDGGAGNDVLAGLAGDDVVIGGSGDDVLDGDAGRDELHGDDGNDTLRGDGLAARSADVLDGGAGRDTAEDWSNASAPVAFTLAGGADDGFAGEGDDVRGVEVLHAAAPGRIVGTDADEELFAQFRDVQISAGGGADELRATDGNDTLDGGAGPDLVIAGGGDDAIVGGPGADTIYGDVDQTLCSRFACDLRSGNDRIDVRDGEADTVDCGPGADTVVADAGDSLRDCEDVQLPPNSGGGSGGGPASGGTPGKPSVTVRSTSLRRALRSGLVIALKGMPAGRRTVKVTFGGRVIATGTAKVGATGSATVRVRFSRRGRAVLKGRRSARLKIAVGGVSRTATLKR